MKSAAPEAGWPPGLSLRAPASADERFLREVYRASRADEFASVPWSEAQLSAFCDSQYDAQAASYARMFPGNRVEVVCLRDEPVGRIIKAMTADGLYILDFAILPHCRNHGIGSALLRQAQSEARGAGTSLVIHVDLDNRAQALYLRHGFVKEAEDAVRATLRWKADLP